MMDDGMLNPLGAGTAGTEQNWLGNALEAQRTEVSKRLCEHFPEYIGGTCLCGRPIANAADWSDHVAEVIIP